MMSGWSPIRTEPHFWGITSGWAVIRKQSVLVELGTNECGDEERWQGPDHQWD
jgi:hypothetical protein